MKRVILFIIVPACLLLVYAGCDSDGTGAETEDDGLVTGDSSPYEDAVSDISVDFSGSETREDAAPDTTSDPYGGHDSVGADAEGDCVAEDAVPADLPPDSSEDEPEPVIEDVCDLDITEPQVLFLSADDSNSQASPVIARALINNNRLVPDWSVRTYEFLNYYTFNYALAEPGRVTIAGQVRQVPDDPERYNLQIGVQSQRLELDDARSMSITFILDTSGSMSGNPIHLLKEACREIAGVLREGDIVSMVEWDTSRWRRLDGHEVSGPDDHELLLAIAGLAAGGGTNLHAGLVEGYAVALENFDPEKLNRVVLISDGQANAGETDENIIALHANDSEREAIYMVGVGVGNGYNDTLMDAVTDKGKGAYVFIDSELEARKIFRYRFLQTFDIAVMRVQVELELPPVLRMEVFHGEEMSGDPKEVEPQHLAPNDAMIFHQTLKMCGTVSPDDYIRATAHYVDRDTREARSDSFALNLPHLVENGGDTIIKGDAIVAYAEGLKEVYQLMKSGSESEAADRCNEVADEVSNAALILLDEELDEIVVLLDTYCSSLGSRSDTSWH